MNKCPNCGDEIKQDISICPNCGHTITGNDKANQGSYFVGFISVMVFSIIGWLFVLFSGKEKTVKAANITMLLWLIIIVISMFKIFFTYLGVYLN